jgi:cysteine synthase A
VEGTAGNTGIGMAHVCNARGYRCVIVMPDNQSPEKYRLIEALGAEVRKVKAVPYSDQNQYQHVAGRLANELPNAIWANQFDNTANRRAHIESTGPEIWAQTGGRIDAFVAASGTGGTLAGTSEFLKSQRASVRAVLPRASTACTRVASATVAQSCGSSMESSNTGSDSARCSCRLRVAVS